MVANYNTFYPATYLKCYKYLKRLHGNKFRGRSIPLKTSRDNRLATDIYTFLEWKACSTALTYNENVESRLINRAVIKRSFFICHAMAGPWFDSLLSRPDWLPSRSIWPTWFYKKVEIFDVRTEITSRSSGRSGKHLIMFALSICEAVHYRTQHWYW